MDHASILWDYAIHFNWSIFFSKFYSASVTEASFFTYHTKIHDTVKGKLAAAKLTSLFSKLQKGFAQGLDQVQTGW